jgi:hypothetical protein
VSTYELGTYKGNPMLILKSSPDDKFPFQFGLKRAKLILEQIENIKGFIKRFDK